MVGRPDSNSNARNHHIREMRQKNSHIGGQQLFERKFQKIGAKSMNAEQLWFKQPPANPIGMRVDASKNHSSIERVYGLDYE